MYVIVQNGLMKCDEAANSAAAESISSRVSVSVADEVMSQKVSAADDVMSQSADDVVSMSAADVDVAVDTESCATVSVITSAVNNQLSCRDSSLSNCCCKTSSCTS